MWGADATALQRISCSRLQPVRRSGQSAQRPRGRWELTRTGHTWGQPRSAANSPRTAITTPRAIFAAAAVARPTTAPHPARTAVAGARDSEYSNSAAPANDPTNAPITLPTIGTGTPITAPTIPPTRAPQADRHEPEDAGDAEQQGRKGVTHACRKRTLSA